jgi:hypothetical protein
VRDIDRANQLHGDAFRRAEHDREVTASILALQLVELEKALRKIAAMRQTPAARTGRWYEIAEAALEQLP